MKTGAGALLVCFAALAGCQKDETVSGYADGSVYRLETLNGTDGPWSATIDLSEPGRVSGVGPCNSYSATQSAPYPWIEIGPIRSTKRACPDLEIERRFFDALSRVTLVEVAGPTLILSDTEGLELVFQVEN